jgi:hypothetical protein
MVMESTGANYERAQELLLKHGSVRNAISNFKSQISN